LKNLKIFEDTLLRILLEEGIIDKSESALLLKERVIRKIPLIDSVYKVVDKDLLLDVLSRLYNASTVSVEKISVNESRIADEMFERFGVVLGRVDEKQADIYLFEPIFDMSLNIIKDKLDKELRLYVVPKDIFDSITKDIRKGIEYKKLYAISTNEQLHSMDEESVAIFFADELLQKCFDMQASDIHIEPLKNGFRVRMRLNGMLAEFDRYDSVFYPSLSSRIKLLANLNIAERRDTQDGALIFKMGDEDSAIEVPFRISVMPTIYGEKIVLRRLNSGEEMMYLSQLGMEDDVLEQWKNAIKRPHGIILVSGPTGSGKSTTLFAAISEINKTNINITTVEDPVEFKIPGVNQIQIDSHKISFSHALRSILRQDPDVIMVGEIRDKETAETALRASLTGHMVFSTIHTNDAVSSATRLVNMGIEPFLVASSVVGVLAQRLIRILCDSCKIEHILKDSECSMLKVENQTKVYRAKGCRKCNGSGYVNRIGVYEFLIVDDEIRQMINQNIGESSIKEYAVTKCGMSTILNSAKKVLLDHRTSFDEVMRIAAE
jgi:type II secretory ATPase GspE/PulE/Tfp pilus assembly ATPase PilB-like protein